MNEAETRAEDSDLFDVLAQDKLTPLLRLKYQDSIADAVTDLGEDIGEAFVAFQKSLYVRLRAELGANQK